MPQQVRGVAASLAASVLFGVIMYLAAQVQAPAEIVFAWRVFVAALCCLALMFAQRLRQGMRALGEVLRRHPAKLMVLVFTTAVVGYQFWLFMWAPQSGHALDVSLGYLLLPICLVLGSRMVLGSRVTKTQWWVVALAAVAVLVTIAGGAPPTWVTLSVCVPYAAYFVVRERVGLNSQATFSVEMLLLVPVAAGIMIFADTSALTVDTMGLLTVIAFCATAAMLCFVAASLLLPLPLFGLLGYAEPLLLVGVALLLGESLGVLQGIAYLILAVALALLATSGFRAGRRPPRLPVE